MNSDNVKEVKAELRDVETLIPYEKNVKKHGDKQVEQIATSIRKFGWKGNPIIVDQKGVIISGHGRRLAALKLGLKKVPVIVEREMTAEQARAFRLADNRVAISDIDSDLLKDELEDLGDEGIDYLEGIFDKKELDYSLADMMQVDDSVFESNLDEVVAEQQNKTNELIDSFDAGRVTIPRALGFRRIPATYAIFVNKFMTSIKTKFGVSNEEAFCAFCVQYVEREEAETKKEVAL